jgi:hypothetical protein
MSSSVVPPGSGPRSRSGCHSPAACGVPRTQLVDRAEDIQLDLPAGRTDGFPLTALDAVGARLFAPRLFAPRARLRGRTDP